MAKFLTKNIHLKILALLTAIFLWTYVINEGYRVDFLDAEIPIEAHNVAEDLAVADNLGTVKLKVRAPSPTWSKISEDKINAFVDLKNLRQGTYTKEVKVSVEDSATTILERDPETINVTLEPLKSLDKDINIEIFGNASEGYETQDPQISETSVEIMGPQSALDKIHKVIAKIELSGEMSEVIKTVEPEAVDENNEKITEVVIIPKTVEVTIPIRKREEVKTVGIKANISGNPAAGFWIKQTNIEPATVAISGDLEKVFSLEYLNTQQIDVSGISSSLEKRVALDLPEGISTLDNSQVIVKIEIDTQITSKAFSVAPKFENLGSGLEIVTISPPEITLQLEGSAPKIDSLLEGDIVVSLNLQGKGAGSYTLSVESSAISLPPDIQLKSIDTDSIKITIKKK